MLSRIFDRGIRHEEYPEGVDVVALGEHAALVGGFILERFPKPGGAVLKPTGADCLASCIRFEAEEELGIRNAVFEKMYDYIMESDVEKELVRTFLCKWDGPINFQKSEIDEVRFFLPDEIEQLLGNGFFTPNFEEEWKYYKNWLKNRNTENCT